MTEYSFLTSGSWEFNASLVRARELGRHLASDGFAVSYLVEEGDYNRTILPQQLQEFGRIVFTPAGWTISAINKRRRLLHEQQPDFVHVLNPSPKSLLTCHGIGDDRLIGDWDEWPPSKKLRQIPILGPYCEGRIDAWFRTRAALSIVSSRWLQSKFAELGFNAGYLPYATYLDEPASTSNPFESPTFVYLGNLYPRFDVDLVFEAARLLKLRGHTPPIEVIGKGPDIERWKAFIKDEQLENVTMRGFLKGPELWQRLCHAAALLFPMRPTIENLARCPSKTFAYAQARRPIITNRVGEIPETLGEKAIYVDTSPEAFADAIACIIDKPVTDDVPYSLAEHTWEARTRSLRQLLAA